MSKIKFIKDEHRYVNESGDDLMSVSKFTDRFKEKVDWNAIAERSAAQATRLGTPTTQEDLLQRWAIKRVISAEIGTLLHSIKETEVIDGSNLFFYNQECKKQLGSYENGHKHSIPINKLENNTVYPELMIYDLDHMICGQADKVIVAKNKINIHDYKTDNEIKFEGWSNQWKKARKFLAPLDHLDDCNGNLYSIKMSLYMYMLWKANNGKLKPGDIIIEHMHLKRDPDKDNIPVLEDGKPVVLKTETIKLPYRKKEVIAMLKTLK